MIKIKNTLFSGLTFLLVLTMQAQTNGQVEMADALRSNGKIYNVVVVLSVVFVGIALYLFYIDRKVKKLEDRFKK